MRILHVVGARPNFMKAAPLVAALEEHGAEQTLVHTGQHYDANMSRVFFEELDLPRPDMDLGVGSGSHAFQTGEVMKRIEPVLVGQEPDVCLVYGDVNSTVAAALVACKLLLPAGHVEAGLRSFDRTMPEEINRLLTDQICGLLFTHSPEAEENLTREGVAPERIHYTGNVMIDTLVRLLPKARARNIQRRFGLDPGEYVLVTLHRPSNVDEQQRLRLAMAALERIASAAPVIFPVHPRTRERLEAFGIETGAPALRIIDPIGYLDFLCLQEAAGAVVTDSGGVQEETTYMGVPCFTVRPNTERPITVEAGTNTLVRTDEELDRLDELVLRCVERGRPEKTPPPLWDGHAAERIAAVIADYLT